MISFSRHLNLHAPPMEDENDQRLEEFLVDQGNTEVRTRTCNLHWKSTSPCCLKRRWYFTVWCAVPGWIIRSCVLCWYRAKWSGANGSTESIRKTVARRHWCDWDVFRTTSSNRERCFPVPLARPIFFCRRFFANANARCTFAICYRPSVCRLSVVCLSSATFVRPTQAIQIFGNISTELCTLPRSSTDMHWKFHGDRPRRTPPPGELNTRGVASQV